MEKRRKTLKEIIELKIVSLKCKFWFWQTKHGFITRDEAFKKTLTAFIEIAKDDHELNVISKRMEELKKEGYIK